MLMFQESLFQRKQKYTHPLPPTHSHTHQMNAIKYQWQWKIIWNLKIFINSKHLDAYNCKMYVKIRYRPEEKNGNFK